MTETIGLNAFNTGLHGARILCQGPFGSAHPPIMDAIHRLREPFKKHVLLTRSSVSVSRYLPMTYDAIFRVADSADWTMALTYLTYAAKPLLVVVEDVTIPDGLWPKITRNMTLVHYSSVPTMHVRPYDAIFFPLTESMTAAQGEFALKVLQSVYRASYVAAEHKEILQELRVAGAGLVWCNVGEAGIFWYDPVSPAAREKLSNEQVAELLGMIADQFKS